MILTLPPEHTEAVEFIIFATGVGSTVTTTLIGEPEHNSVPGAVPVHGVILYVTVWAVDPVLSRVCDKAVASGVPVALALAPVILAPTALTVHV